LYKFFRPVVSSLIAALLLAACGSLSAQAPTPTVPPVVTLKVSGSGTITNVLEALKPQFEAGRQQVGRGKGVIRNPVIHRQVLTEVLGYALQQGYGIRGLIRSPLVGPKGNVEFLAWLEYPGELAESVDGWVDLVLAEPQ